MSTLINDIKYALRQLGRSPGFTAVAVLTLALGIGANLALFGILNEMLLRPKPVARPHELWAAAPVNAAGKSLRTPLTYRPFYDAVRQEGRIFKDVIGYTGIEPKLRTEGGYERLRAELVAGDYFSFLGVVPVLGRDFLPEENTQTGACAVAVISHAFWKNRFGGKRDVLGKTVTLNNIVVEIVGVAPKEFTGLNFCPPSLWLPASLEPVVEKQSPTYEIVGRLTEPKLAATAADRLTQIAAEVQKKLSASQYPELSLHGVSADFHRIRLDPMGRGLLGTSYLKPKIVSFLTFAAIATVLLLLISCANVAGLFLARALQRGKETATRIALGATRMDLMRQVVCEGILVAAGGTLAALLVFSWVSRVILQCVSWWPDMPLRLLPDLRVLLFAAGTVLVVGMGASLLPALQATTFAPFTVLKDGQGIGCRRQRLRHGLIVAQVAGSLVLLCSATLCLRCMSKQLAVDLGYDHNRLVIAPLDLERIGFTADTFEPQLAEITRRVALIPGIEQVGVSCVQPLSGSVGLMDASAWLPEGYDPSNDNSTEVARYGGTGPGMFSVMGIPLLRGREFCREDIESNRKVFVVNESFVKRFWPGQDPLGKHIYLWEVIGVVKDACLDQSEQPDAAVFSMAKKESLLHATLLIRTTGDARRVVASVRTELARIHPRLIDGEIRSLRDIMKNALAFQHMAMRILGALGVLALVLASVGTYGVMAYVVNSRTREVGIRLAVGATQGDVMRMVLFTGLRLGLVAVAIGIPLSLGAAVVLRHQIAGISPFDPVTFIAVVASVLTALIAACWLPARRAAKIDPMEALRYE